MSTEERNESNATNNSHYATQIAFDAELDSTVISLFYQDRANPARNIEVSVAPDLGSNLFRFRVGEHDIIYCEPALLKRKDFTGNFVLWPFPNRMRDKRYTYQGQSYSLEGLKRPQGNDVLIHGLVFDRPWQHEQPLADQDSASVTTCIDFGPESPFYEGYPFESRLSLTYTLTKNSVTVTYNVQNKGAKQMPFGFALHPYFALLSGKENTLVRIPTNYVMEADDELLPTGRLLKLEGIMYAMFDLRAPVPVGHLKLDHVYTGMRKNESALIEYRQQAMKLHLITSGDFTHMVIYTPTEAPFFCLENQTCSTDAVNLHQQGLMEEAHLLELSPGESSTGFIRYVLEFEQ
ncbi:MAG TPA: aldose 1-epimerase [Ktedonobacteraceae bacterium]|nr:aldose 1-epimerase [Ktedonobacteraceae bacterium]